MKKTATSRYDVTEHLRTPEEMAAYLMRKKIHYTDEPLGELRVVPDFLPPPDGLQLREEIAKILARGDEDIDAGNGIDMETVMAEADALLAKKP